MPMPKLSDVGCSRGAPMGRRNVCEMLPEEVGKVYLQLVPFVDGDYDRGGAYWGAVRGQWLWRAYCEQENTKEEIDVFDQFLRAKSREQAKDILRQQFPNIRFYR